MTDWPNIIAWHGPLVWHTARRLLQNEADASDCFQKVFLNAVEWDRKEPIENWPAVLRTLATSRAIEMLRSRIRDRNRMEALPEAIIDRNLAEPASKLLADELAGQLRTAITQLPEQQATLFCLVHLEGMSNIEAANLLGISANHAGVLLSRARTALRETLQPLAPKEARS